jgi:gamma-glutamyl-gamma-aminobutyrate hydrolase PuuD
MKLLYVLGYIGYADPFQKLFNKVQRHDQSSFPQKETPIPDMILFTGGEDISPAMYGEDHQGHHYEEVSTITPGYIAHRDRWEEAWYHWAWRHNVRMFGTCRGMQFFTVMNGGKLIQHVENHYKAHLVFTKKGEGGVFRVNSIHHQMCVPKGNTSY